MIQGSVSLRKIKEASLALLECLRPMITDGELISESCGITVTPVAIAGFYNEFRQRITSGHTHFANCAKAV